ncbi:PepSY-associated TM helix domain-containing protein [Parahaliea maris]|uniref:PepSY-associated TM helix domain-containing protein n=1 Tax=Parahaliea maris TaxID=2716870 RepID=UPI00164F1D23|nr:PepSY-associated TM helix domain-containing protein [Parahaliea maris]
MRKFLFNLHWILGITLGTLLAISGVTGGLMAFKPELIAWANGVNEAPEEPTSQRLPAEVIYERVLAQTSEFRLLKLTLYPGRSRYYQAELLRRASGQNAMGSMPQPEMRLVDPYTGEVLGRSSLGASIEATMAWLQKIHEGHWFRPDHILSTPVWTSMSVAAFCLYFVVLSGLYLRWPRGRLARKPSAWLKIDFRLNGRAFLRNLHMVMGTVLLLIYLIVAHTGTFQSTPLKWYGQTVRDILGQPQEDKPPPPPPGGPATTSDVPAIPVNEVIPLFTAARNFTGWQKMVLQLQDNDPVLSGESERMTFRIAIDPVTGDVESSTLRQKTDENSSSFAQMLVERNQDIHEGRIFGIPGVVVMMTAAFSMPVFYVTGWVMYLQRRKRLKSSNRQRKGQEKGIAAKR